MPYQSRAQQGWAHTPAGTKALGGPEKVKEWDEATKGHYGSLPERVQHLAAGGPVMAKGYHGKDQDDRAKGGASLGRTRNFLKEADGQDQYSPKRHPYKNPDLKVQAYGKADGDDDDGKGRAGSSVKPKRVGDTKELKTVKPRS